MIKATLVGLFLFSVYASGQEKEIFKPQQAEVSDFFIDNSTLYIQTTRGYFKRVTHSVYIVTDEPDLKSNRLKRRPDSITIERGALHITHKTTYNRRFDNYSVRYNDSLYVSTYEGIFFKNKKINYSFLSAGNGNIRQYNGYAYICFGGLAIVDEDSLINRYSANIDGEFDINGLSLGVLNDIVVIEDKWLVNTSIGIFSILNSNITDTIFFFPDRNSRNQANGRFFQDDEYHIEGFISNIWFSINKQSFEAEVIEEFEGEVLNVDESRNRVVTTTSYIYSGGIGGTKYDNSKLNLHGTFNIDETLYGFSDNGLFILEAENEKLIPIPLILNEFNKHSLRLTNDSVYIGSINGLWSFSKTDMPQPLKNSTTTLLTSLKSQQYLIFVIIVLTIIICFLIIKNFKTKRPELLNSKHNSDKDSILAYIESNLTTVTILGILQEFGLSQKTLYDMFYPVKPGEIIKAKRLEKLEYYHMRGKTNEELAALTGFSKDYISKVLLPELTKQRL